MADSEPNPDPETAGITGQRRTLPGDTKAAVPLPPGRFKPWEEWAWDMISIGQFANMSEVPLEARGSEDVDKPPVTNPVRRTDEGTELDDKGLAIAVPNEDWPAWQRLSPEFVHLTLVNPQWRDSKVRQRVFIQLARFDYDLNLSSESIKCDLGFYNCAFGADVNFLGATIDGLLSLQGSLFEGDLTCDSLKTSGSMFLRRGAVFRGDVRLPNASIGGDLDGSDSQFESDVVADGIQMRGDAFLSNRSVFKGRIRLLGAKVGSDLNCSSSIFEGGFHADRIETAGSILLNESAEFQGPVRLIGAKIGADLLCSKGRFKSQLNADRLETGGNVILSGEATFEEDVRILGGRIHGSLYGTRSVFEKAIRCDGIEVEGDIFLREGAVIKGMLNLPGARIGQDLHLWGATFGGLVALAGAQIGGELRLDETKLNFPHPSWGESAYINLQNARLRALQGSFAAWKSASGKFVPRDLDGLTFDRAGGGVGGACLEDAKVEDLICWLEDDTEPNGGKVRRSDYSPSPYRALAQALDASGHRSKARRVRWALARREKRALSWFNPLKYLSALSGLVIGYGYFQARGLIVFLGLVTAYAAIGHLWTADWKPTLPTVASAVDFAEWLRFSLSNAVPVVELDPVKEDFLPAKFGEPIPEPVRWVFWSHRLLALILLSLIIAGLTGWAQRRGE